MNILQSLNHFKYRFKYRYGKHLPLIKPVDVSLELSSFCNMSCKCVIIGSCQNQELNPTQEVLQ
jgi:hypothetical protein